MSADLSIANKSINTVLGTQTAQNLAFLHKWAESAPAHVVQVHGVNILECLIYELIQLVNNAFLGAFISEQVAAAQEDVAPETEVAA